MQTGGVRVFYGVSTVSRRCFGEGVAITRKVTVRLPYGACTGPYGTCASTVWNRTCLRTPVELYDHCTWPVRDPYVARTGPDDGRECTYEFLVPYDCLRAFYGKKKYVHAQLSDTGCLRA